MVTRSFHGRGLIVSGLGGLDVNNYTYDSYVWYGKAVLL